MSEKLSISHQSGPDLSKDRSQFTDAELNADPIKRFQVNPKDFPIFSQQVEHETANHDRNWDINYTLGKYVGQTESLINVINGANNEDDFDEEVVHPKYNHVIYLDKSARPVSWLVNQFWNDFSSQGRPAQSFLAIDRAPWFQRAGLDVDEDGRFIDDEKRLATFSDFEQNIKKIDPKHYANIRALFIKGGIPEGATTAEIMKMPTILDGKNILIIDEVSRTGSTQKIAKHLLSHAIPDAKLIDAHTFWDDDIYQYGSTDAKEQTTTYESELRSAPVWYPPANIASMSGNTISTGRGVGNIDPSHYVEQYNKSPNPHSRARKMGALALSTPLKDETKSLGYHPMYNTEKLRQEITKMHEEYQKGHILPIVRKDFNVEQLEGILASFNIKLGSSDPKKSYAEIKAKLASR